MQRLKAAANKIFNNEQSSVNAKTLYAKLTCSNSVPFNESLRLLGPVQKITLSLTQKTIVENFIEETIYHCNVNSFQRCICQNILYHVEDYQRMKKKN